MSEPVILDAPESDYDSETEIESDTEIDTSPLPIVEKEHIYAVLLDDTPKYYTTTQEEAEKCLEQFRKNLLKQLTAKYTDSRFLSEYEEEDSVRIWRVDTYIITQYNSLQHTLSIQEIPRVKLD